MKAREAHIKIEESTVVILDRHEHCIGIAFSLPAALDQLEEARDHNQIGWRERRSLKKRDTARRPARGT